MSEEKQREEQIEKVSALLGSVKEVLSASFRSPTLFSEFVEKMLAYDQRQALVRFHKEFKERVDDPVAPLSPIQERRVSYRRKQEGSSNTNKDGSFASGTSAQSDNGSPLQSPRGSPASPTSPRNGDAGPGNHFQLPPTSSLLSGAAVAQQPQSSGHASGYRRSLVAGSPIAEGGAGAGGASACVKAYRDALLGIVDAPNDLESYPQPLQPGLLHGETKLLEKFFRSYPKILEFFVERLDKEPDTLEALSEANMLWLGKHPTDYEMSGRENVKWQALSETSGSGAKRKDLPHKMRHLLLLNLQLHHSPQEWVELLSLRDRLIDLLRRAAQEVPAANSDIGDVLCAMELASTGLELIRIDSNPSDVKELLLVKSNQVSKSINKALLNYQKTTQSAGFFTKMSADAQQLKSVVGMLKRILGELTDEILKIEAELPGEMKEALATGESVRASAN